MIRSYTLATGRRRLILSGGTKQDYFYGYPEVSGNRVVLVREPGNVPGPQLWLEDLSTHHLRALTPSGAWNDEPSISGNVVAWMHGRLTIGHTHGLVVANLATGRRVALKRSSAQLPRVVAGRYVVFATDSEQGSVQVYDAQTGSRRTLAGGQGSGFVPDQTVAAGGNAVLFSVHGSCSAPEDVCPVQYTLASLQ